jgi:succinate dehydrogenase hydrophobic anchor subunit
MNDSSSVTMILLLWLVLIALWVVGSYYVAKFAKKAGRSFAAWFLLSLIISPIWMGLFIAIKDYSGKGKKS